MEYQVEQSKGGSTEYMNVAQLWECEWEVVVTIFPGDLLIAESVDQIPELISDLHYLLNNEDVLLLLTN